MDLRTRTAVAGIVVLAAVLGLWLLLRPLGHLGVFPARPAPEGTEERPGSAELPSEGAAPGETARPPAVPSELGDAVPEPTPTAAPAAAQVEPYGSLEVRVIWEGDQKPAAGTGVRVLPFNAPDPFFNEETIFADAEGIARCERVHSGKVGLYGVFGGELRTAVDPGRETKVTLAIPLGATIEGIVVDGDGRPVADAGIVLCDDGGGGDGPIVAVTGPEGTFRLRGVSVRGWRRIGARAAGHAPSAMAMVSANAGGTVKLRLVLDQPGGELAGRVLDPYGNPVAKARVRVGQDEYRQFALPDGMRATNPGMVTSSTDEQGRFRFVGLALGKNLVQVRSPSWASWRGEAVIEATAGPELDVHLQPGVVLRGSVVDTEKKPLSRVAIQVNGYGDLLSSFVRTRENGTFALSGLEPGTITVEADGGDRGKATAKFDAAPGQELSWEAVLDGGLAIRGRLLDKDSRPLEDWSVLMETVQLSDFKWTKTGADGRFSATGCVDAQYAIKVRAPGGKGMAQTQARGVRPGGPEVVIRLTEDLVATCYILGSVLGPDGLGLGGVEVVYWREGQGSGLIELTKEGSGAFEHGPISPGTYRVSLRVPGFVEWRSGKRVLKAEETWDLGAIALQRPGTLRVRLTHAPEMDVAQTRFYVTQGDRSEDGGFRIEKDSARSGPIEPGAWALHAGGPGILPSTTAVEIRAGEETLAELTLEAGAQRTLRFREPEGITPAKQVRVTVRNASGAAVIDSDFTLSKGPTLDVPVTFEPGTYSVEARTDSGRAASGRLTIDTVAGPLQVVEFPLR